MTKTKATTKRIAVCAWCGATTDQPAAVPLNFGRQAIVCPKCYAFDDGER